ncbi:ABC transporter permease [Cellulomonas sp. KRMCY2]|uniref:ABC transporter permease n=1 Tax=Cellulomonas sp. KRMCY2 TaxID=1304865 RepID=UPI00045E652E|nr:ABC-2 family transporter protein [Cellulomonas sp. KRMCY2]
MSQQARVSAAPAHPTLADSTRVTWALTKAAVRGAAQYRFNFVILALMGIAYQGSGFAFIAVVLSRYPSIGGWTFPEIAVLYALRLVAHAVYLVPLYMLNELDDLVRNGTFDRFLVRPLNPLVQVLTRRFSVNTLGDVITAVGILVFASSIADLTWTPTHILFGVTAVVGGALIEGGLALGISAMSFRFVEVWPARYLVDNILLNFGSYPLSVFGFAAQWFMTWILPVAFIAWVPAAVILDRTAGLGVSATVAWLAPVVGAIWFALGYQVWRRQLRSYASTGN